MRAVVWQQLMSCVVKPLNRSNWRMNLDLAQLALLRQMDGQRTIRQMAHALALSPLFQHLQTAELEAYALGQFQSFWQLDFLAMGMA